MKEEKRYWHNYKTGEIEYREAPTTDAEALELISQLPAAQGLYDCRRKLGDGILDAMMAVLTACVGVDA